jgi:hypothetical protein
MYQPLIQH